jgi:hypothetical protein
MLFDLSPYLSLQAFGAIWIMGMLALVCVIARQHKEGE